MLHEAQKRRLVAGAQLRNDLGVAAEPRHRPGFVGPPFFCHAGAFQDGPNDSCGAGDPPVGMGGNGREGRRALNTT